MATNASIGKGLQLLRGDGNSPEGFDLVAEVSEIGGLGSEASLEEATHFQSQAKEYVLGLTDGVEFPVTANFLPDDSSQSKAAGLIADHDDRVQRNFQMTHPDWQSTFSFTALIRAWKVNGFTPGAVMKVQFTLKISGDIAYT